MMKKRILGTLFGFLALFGFGAIYYGLLTADSAAALMARYDEVVSMTQHGAHSAWKHFGSLLAGLLLR